MESNDAALADPICSTITSRIGMNISEHSDQQHLEGDSQNPALIGQRKKLKIIVEDLEEIYLASISALEDPSKAAVFRGMFRCAQIHFDRFMSLFDELLDLASLDEPPDTDRCLRALAKRYYYGACSQEGTLLSIDATPCKHADHSIYTTGSSLRSLTKVPSIKLPEFDGQITSWLRFKETFE